MDSPFHLSMSSATCSARGRTEKIMHVEGKRELPSKPPKAAEEAAFEMRMADNASWPAEAKTLPER